MLTAKKVVTGDATDRDRPFQSWLASGEAANKPGSLGYAT